MNKLLWIPAVLAVILTGIFVSRLATGLKIKHGTDGAFETSSESPNVSIDHFSYVQEKDGENEWRVSAKRAEVFEAEHRAQLSDVRITVHNSGGVGVSLEGDEGVFDTLSKNVLIRQHRGNVRLLLDNGLVAETNRLAWDHAAREMSSPDPVRIHGPNVDIHGIGFVLNASTRSVRVLKDVRVAITP